MAAMNQTSQPASPLHQAIAAGCLVAGIAISLAVMYALGLSGVLIGALFGGLGGAAGGLIGWVITNLVLPKRP
jgi:hypothetical protein